MRIASADKFKGKVSVVTGAGSGIGKGLALRLAAKGAKVVVSDINKERLDKVRDELQAAGADVEAMALDVTDGEAFMSVAADTADRHGRIDYLFNNAGIGVVGHTRDLSGEDWRNVMEINLFGVINGVQAVYPMMVKQGFGHIVNIASLGGLIPAIGHLPYVTSKYAVVGLSQGLRMEAERHGVNVSVACPGYIDTCIFKESKKVNIDGGKALKGLERSRLMPPEECARDILRGVARNEEVIVVTDMAKAAWLLERLAPGLMRILIKWECRELMSSRLDARRAV